MSFLPRDRTPVRRMARPESGRGRAPATREGTAIETRRRRAPSRWRTAMATVLARRRSRRSRRTVVRAVTTRRRRVCRGSMSATDHRRERRHSIERRRQLVRGLLDHARHCREVSEDRLPRQPHGARVLVHPVGRARSPALVRERSERLLARRLAGATNGRLHLRVCGRWLRNDAEVDWRLHRCGTARRQFEVADLVRRDGLPQSRSSVGRCAHGSEPRSQVRVVRLRRRRTVARLLRHGYRSGRGARCLDWQDREQGPDEADGQGAPRRDFRRPKSSSPP